MSLTEKKQVYRSVDVRRPNQSNQDVLNASAVKLFY